MGATHAKRRLYGVTEDLTGREGSLKGGSRQGSARSPCPGSEVSEPPEAGPEPRLTEEDKRKIV